MKGYNFYDVTNCQPDQLTILDIVWRKFKRQQNPFWNGNSLTDGYFNQFAKWDKLTPPPPNDWLGKVSKIFCSGPLPPIWGNFRTFPKISKGGQKISFWVIFSSLEQYKCSEGGGGQPVTAMLYWSTTSQVTPPPLFLVLHCLGGSFLPQYLILKC